jgi:hypothetical protein
MISRHDFRNSRDFFPGILFPGVLLALIADLFRYHHDFFLRHRIERRPINAQVGHHELRRRVSEPFGEREILIEAAFEHLQEDQVCIPRILDVMQQGFFHVPDVSCLKVHGPR